MGFAISEAILRSPIIVNIRLDTGTISSIVPAIKIGSLLFLPIDKLCTNVHYLLSSVGADLILFFVSEQDALL